ncbi:MAG: GNAT family N-acetyltransferase, partial [Gammaproteobacteria bacterium]|nr:GNAT family N-acetyltransferase [Gammaproteobacteria bacterium]
MIFETRRTQVRHLTVDDTDAMFEVYGDAEAMRWVDDGQPIAFDDCIRWIDVSKKNYSKYGYGMSAIVHRADGGVLGFCGLVHPGAQVDAEIKYALRRQYWGQGLATEVAA